MQKEELRKLIFTSSGKEQADTVIKNAKIVDVYSGEIIEGEDIAIVDGKIAGIGHYEGKEVVDAQGSYAMPGFIDGHIHIESSYVTPEEMGRLVTPRGTTTIIADPHEIVNVAGLDGMEYMLDAAKHTKLDIQYMLPSCVPATPFEHSGATILAEDMTDTLKEENVLGLGEFMNFPGVINGADMDLDKILAAKENKQIIDGHSPAVYGKDLDAYIAAGIHTDHECETVEDAKERIRRGMYVMLREGSACHNLKTMLKAVTKANSRRFIFCSDDRQPKTILELGHLDNHLRICAKENIDPIEAVRMASLNAAECYGLADRGAIAPGLRADIVLADNLTDYHVQKVWIAGELVAKDGEYLFPVERTDMTAVTGKFHVKDFSEEKLKLHLKSSKVKVIDILPGGVVTGKGEAEVKLDQDGDFVYDPDQDIVKVAVVERHHATGNVGVALLRGYGIQKGAVAISIAHDSHNIIAVGTNDKDIAFAVEQLISQGGGIVLANEQKVVDSMPFVVGGIMTDQTGEWVNEHLTRVHENARKCLGISGEVEPIMTLCFMSLPVIPALKLTDMGLFDVTTFAFTSIEA